MLDDDVICLHKHARPFDSKNPDDPCTLDDMLCGCDSLLCQDGSSRKPRFKILPPLIGFHCRNRAYAQRKETWTADDDLPTALATALNVSTDAGVPQFHPYAELGEDVGFDQALRLATAQDGSALRFRIAALKCNRFSYTRASSGDTHGANRDATAFASQLVKAFASDQLGFDPQARIDHTGTYPFLKDNHAWSWQKATLEGQQEAKFKNTQFLFTRPDEDHMGKMSPSSIKQGAFIWLAEDDLPLLEDSINFSDAFSLWHSKLKCAGLLVATDAFVGKLPVFLIGYAKLSVPWRPQPDFESTEYGFYKVEPLARERPPTPAIATPPGVPLGTPAESSKKPQTGPIQWVTTLSSKPSLPMSVPEAIEAIQRAKERAKERAEREERQRKLKEEKRKRDQKAADELRAMMQDVGNALANRTVDSTPATLLLRTQCYEGLQIAMYPQHAELDPAAIASAHELFVKIEELHKPREVLLRELKNGRGCDLAKVERVTALITTTNAQLENIVEEMKMTVQQQGELNTLFSNAALISEQTKRRYSKAISACQKKEAKHQELRKQNAARDAARYAARDAARDAARENHQRELKQQREAEGRRRKKEEKKAAATRAAAEKEAAERKQAEEQNISLDELRQKLEAEKRRRAEANQLRRIQALTSAESKLEQFGGDVQRAADAPKQTRLTKKELIALIAKLAYARGLEHPRGLTQYKREDLVNSLLRDSATRLAEASSEESDDGEESEDADDEGLDRGADDALMMEEINEARDAPPLTRRQSSLTGDKAQGPSAAKVADGGDGFDNRSRHRGELVGLEDHGDRGNYIEDHASNCGISNDRTSDRGYHDGSCDRRHHSQGNAHSGGNDDRLHRYGDRAGSSGCDDHRVYGDRYRGAQSNYGVDRTHGRNHYQSRAHSDRYYRNHDRWGDDDQSRDHRNRTHGRNDDQSRDQ